MITVDSLKLDVFLLADYVVSRGQPKTKRAVTHLKLQKLVYYAQAYVIVFTGKSLLAEPIQAWRHGPVCPKLYERFKCSSFHELEPSTNSDELRARLLAVVNEDTLAVIDDVLEVYGEYAGSELETMIRQESPWINAMARGRNSEILPEEIQKFFNDVVNV